MTLKALARSLDEVAAHLPFAVDDYARANGAFARWLETGADADLKVVELWLYVYARRYFLAKFIREPGPGLPTLDEPVGEAFRRARAALDHVEQPDRFASYISVLCKNVYLSSCKRHAQAALVDLDHAPELAADPAADGFEDLDASVVRHAVDAAVARLPPSLREVAQRRLLDGEPYEVMEEKTGRSQAVLRSTYHKAVARLREDPALKILAHEWDL